MPVELPPAKATIISIKAPRQPVDTYDPLVGKENKMTDDQYKDMIKKALNKWLAGDPSTTNLIKVLLEDVVRVVVKENSIK